MELLERARIEYVTWRDTYHRSGGPGGKQASIASVTAFRRRREVEKVDLVRIDFALIPDEPLFGSVVRASQAIIDEFYYNENVIDDKTFPRI
jgi:hypothetical protein